MAIAQPQYLEAVKQSVSAGQQFNYFLNLWDSRWGKISSGRDAALATIKIMGEALKLKLELINRQAQMAKVDPHVHSFEATSTSPLMTGMGIDHPIENGFSFLRPYGLPYLPGSSVKGLLRTAAEDLALGFDQDDNDWSLFTVWLLFGLDDDTAGLNSNAQQEPDVIAQERNRRTGFLKAWAENLDQDNSEFNHLKTLTGLKVETPLELVEGIQGAQAIRGAIDFWDVYINVNSIGLDILTPHQGHYYQHGKQPDDCGQPVPNPFIVVPDKSGFNFHLRCNAMMQNPGFPKAIRDNIENLLTVLMDHAFDWHGFGSKTSLGYGAMRRES